MKRISRIALAAAALVAAGGVIAATAQADGRWKHGEGRGGEYGAYGHHGHGGRGMMRMFDSFDANADGALTQEEIDGVRGERFAAFDGDGDKALTLGEYQALWLDAMRERMVDRFQHLDADGDGKVTAEEFSRPFARMVARADRNDDGKLDRDDRRQHRFHDDDDDDDRRGSGPHRDSR
jgi:hypothetical protein